MIRQADWPLVGSALTTMRLVFDTAGRVPERAEFQHTGTGASVQVSENLPSERTFGLGPGRVTLLTRSGQDHDLSWLNRRPADSQEPGSRRGCTTDSRSGPCSCRGPVRTAASMWPCRTAGSRRLVAGAGREPPGPAGRRGGDRRVHRRR
ncbi:hypothetical protein ACFQ60_09435 [Streptomyces zhihengii]